MAVCVVGKLGFGGIAFCFVYTFSNDLAAPLEKTSFGEQGTRKQDILPSWLNAKGVVFNIVFTIVIVLLDILFVSWMEGNHFADDLLSKVMGGLMIAASILANFWMIHKKIDTWIWWIVYTLAGMVIYVLTSNIFTFVLFLITLVLNIKAAIEWIKVVRANNSAA